MVLVVGLVVAAVSAFARSKADTSAVVGTTVAHLAAAGATTVAAGERSAGTMVVSVESVVGCPWSPDDRAAGPERGRRVIELAYCALLDRPVEVDGLAYWTGELERGVPVPDVLLALLDSPEYRAGRDLTPVEALASLRRSADTTSTSIPAVPPSSASTTSSSSTAAIAPAEVPDGLRPRQAMSAAAFERFVAGRDLDSTDWVTDALVHGRLAAMGQRINVVYVHLSATRGVRVSPGGRGRSVVGSWAEEIGAHAAVNGNWYGPWDGPAVSGGVSYAGTDHFYTALFGFTADGEVVVEHHRAVHDEVDPRIVEGVSGHPTLIFRGERTTDFGGDPAFAARHPRTAIALDLSGDVLILVTVDGRSSVARGMTGGETAELLERLGAHDAVMLDGGGSTTMWIAGRGVVNRPSGTLRAVGNQLAVFGD
jgi:hypothetical protein